MNKFTDSFSHYSTLAHLLAKWTGSHGGTPAVGAPYAISSAAQGVHLQSATLSVNIPNYTRYFFGIRYKIISVLQAAELLAAMDNGNPQVTMQLEASGLITLRRGALNGTLLATSSLSVTSGSTHYYELDCKVDPATGIANAYVDGILYCTFAGNTRNSGVTQINQLRIGTAHLELYGADCYINDDQGSICNAVQGDTVIQPYTVASAGTHADFSRGGVNTGTNAGQLAKALADTTSFNLDNVINHRDSFTMAAVGAGTIIGARAWMYAQKDSIGVRKIAQTIESSGTDDIGPDELLSSGAYGFYSRDASTDPHTSALWASLAAFNAAKHGYKITL